jgi:Mn2+/Fe2+ NRAMP family transporter
MSNSNPTQPKNPPQNVTGILRQLGPGLIIAGSIVGSGELIATTKTGAEAGFWLLWLIVIGCVIKVFTQVEFGRFTIVTGKTTLEGLDSLPGPRWRVNWILWYWLIMFLVSMAQLGGIVGGVGQALAIAAPLTSEGRAVNEYHDSQTRSLVARALVRQTRAKVQFSASDGETRALQARIQELEQLLASLEENRWSDDAPPVSHDDVIWAAIIAVLTSGMLLVGRYGLVQALSTILVAGFTAVTVGNLIHLQTIPDWRVTLPELAQGLSFRLPPAVEQLGRAPLATALATLGIIGVGATELIQYPYWCREKGYARWTGALEQTREWAGRARGWMRVLRWDAWCSAVIYTFATAAFYLLGAAVLGRTGLNPEGTQMIRTLGEMYVPVFGSIAQVVFLFGAIVVLYSTFFVANAGHARVCADAMRVFQLSPGDERSRRFWERTFSGFFPLACLLVYMAARAPVKLVMASGVMQAIMLPMLGFAALYFRYRRIDRRLLPGRLWDMFLWLSFLGLLLAGGWLALSKLIPQLT